LTKSAAAASIAAKRVRASSSSSRSGVYAYPTFHASLLAAAEPDDTLLVVEAVLRKLARRDPLKAQLVELRFFAGLTGEQAAEVVGISSSAADRHWVFARAWLRRELGVGQGKAQY
jgi:DNA-directed RNA polymerase specialized sigma24 family protein